MKNNKRYDIKNILKMRSRWIIIAIVILFTGIMIMVFVPTEGLYSHNTLLIEERLYRDLSIYSNQVKFVAGKFHRESIIVYHVQKSDVTTSQFRPIISEKQKRDCAKRVAEITAFCGIDIKVSLSDDFFVFYGSDYSVILLNNDLNSYLIYLGAE